MRIEGTTQLLGLVDLLQVAELNRRNYWLRLSKADEEGVVVIENGVICHAARGDSQGAVAVIQLTAWTDSQVEISPLSYKPPVNITPDRYFLLALGMQAAKAARRPTPDSSWRLCGDLQLMPAGELLEVFEMNRLPVHIRFSSAKGAASVFVSEGEAIHAEFVPAGAAKADLSPQEIIFDLIAWPGTFEVSVAGTLPDRTIEEPLSYLILEGTRLAEERMAFPRERLAEEQAHAIETQRAVEEGKASDSVRSLVAKRYLARGRTAPVDTLLNLSRDENAKVSDQALNSISRLPLPIVKTLAGDSQTPDVILRHLVEEFWDEDTIMRALAENSAASEETLGLLASFASEAVLAVITKDLARLARSEVIKAGIANRGDRNSKLKRKRELDLKKRTGGSIHKRILEMNLPDKIFLAFRGSAAERAILASNPVQLVATAVLKSPKLTEGEVENLASMKSVNVDVLEGISDNPQWINQYPIARAVATNPKTPGHIGIDLLKRMRETDLQHICKDHNLPESVRSSAKRRLDILEKKKGKR